MPRGELTMLLGRNGAGKTTTLRTILGLWRASAGAIRFEGDDIAQRDTPAIANLGIAYVPESMGIFAGLTVRENLLLAARRGPPDEARLEWIFRFFPPMKKFWHLPAGTALGRPEADAVDLARHRRAEEAGADRRADQGPRARDHQQPDRGASPN